MIAVDAGLLFGFAGLALIAFVAWCARPKPDPIRLADDYDCRCPACTVTKNEERAR
jgi:hypothetical protein